MGENVKQKHYFQINISQETRATAASINLNEKKVDNGVNIVKNKYGKRVVGQQQKQYSVEACQGWLDRKYTNLRPIGVKGQFNA